MRGALTPSIRQQLDMAHSRVPEDRQRLMQLPLSTHKPASRSAPASRWEQTANQETALVSP